MRFKYILFVNNFLLVLGLIGCATQEIGPCENGKKFCQTDWGGIRSSSDDKGAGDGSVSADGRFLVASSTRFKGQSAIWLFDRQVGTWRQLTKPGNGDREPAISPNGRFVVFISDRNDRTDLWALDTATGWDSRTEAGGQPCRRS